MIPTGARPLSPASVVTRSPAIPNPSHNPRHVQHHAAQLNLILRQETGSAPGWVGKALDEPPAV